MSKKNKILFLGQTPPPFHGQALIIEKILKHDYSETKLIHVRLNFSSQLSQVGKFKASKILNLFQVLVRSFYFLVSIRVIAIYYPPSGHALIPILRDIIIIFFLRLFRRKIIFHFHILGISNFYSTTNRLLRFLMEVYMNPDYCICVSEKNVYDISFLQPKKILVIPNGIEDQYINFQTVQSRESPPMILYVGNLYKSKGVSDLLDSAYLLTLNSIPYKLVLVGGFKDQNYRKEVEQHPLYGQPNIHFMGILTGQEKWKQFEKADIFCFPPLYPESFSIVTVEAMSFGLPIITTDTRASYDEMVIDSLNGYVVERGNTSQIAAKLELLLNQEELRKKMGNKSRELFLKKFQESKFLNNFESFFNSIH